MSTTPPPPPPSSPTQIAGQQTAPSSSVPVGPAYTLATGAHTNTLAVVSLVAGIGSFFAHVVPGIGGFTVSLIAIITGYMARQQIKQTGERGMGMATAGIVIGVIHLALIGFLVIVVLFLIFVLGVALFRNATR